jgi:proline dehydrogenase
MRLLDTLIVKTLPLVPKAIVGRLSRPYIAGAKLEDAVRVVKDLNEKGFLVTVDVLGEFVSEKAQVQEGLKEYLELLDAMEREGLKGNISIKPTSFGLLLDEGFCREILDTLMKKVVACNRFMRIDMEDSPCTSKTIALYQHFRERYPDHVGIVFQSYLRRTNDDVLALTKDQPSHFRLCKGIYVEPEPIAYKGYQEVRDHFLKVLKTMLQSGSFVGIATHDDYLVEGAERLIRDLGVPENGYEFQMLLGVREKLRDELLAKGHKVRIYVPFGKDWYGYSTRRLKENPALAGTFFKAMFFGD